MIRQLIVPIPLVPCGTVAFSLATARVAGQAAAPAAPARAGPRGPDGKPNFSGIWEGLSKADWNIEPHSASRIGPARGGGGDGGLLPYQPSALAKRAQNFGAPAAAG